MITVIHYRKGGYGVKPCIRTCTTDTPCSCSYTIGYDKPNYPVPAIPWVDTCSLNYWINGVVEN